MDSSKYSQENTHMYPISCMDSKIFPIQGRRVVSDIILFEEGGGGGGSLSIPGNFTSINNFNFTTEGSGSTQSLLGQCKSNVIYNFFRNIYNIWPLSKIILLIIKMLKILFYHFWVLTSTVYAYYLITVWLFILLINNRYTKTLVWVHMGPLGFFFRIWRHLWYDDVTN